MSQSFNNKKSKNYLVSLIIICLLVMGICVFYLKLQFKVTNSSNQINALQSQLSRIKEKNDVIYNEKVNFKNSTETKKNLDTIQCKSKPLKSKSKNPNIIQYKDIPKTEDIK